MSNHRTLAFEQSSKNRVQTNKPIIYISQEKIDTQSQLNIEQIPIVFPYKPYQCQTEYMTSIIKSLNKKENSLIQCPTGTGKTLSLLCSTLGWLYYQQQKISALANLKIIYASRTHSQLKQVVKQLKKTVYCPSMIIASSRDYSCCNSELRTLQGHAKELQCRKRIGRIDGKGCQYFKDESVMGKVQNQIKNKVMDIQDLVDYGKSNKICPFYYSKKAKQFCNMILMPYNYLFDRSVARNFNIDYKNSIIILDEGHNITQISEQGFSSSITTTTLFNAIEQLSSLKQMLLQKDETKNTTEKQKYQTTISMIQKFLAPLVNLHEYLQNQYYSFFEGISDNIDQGCIITVDKLLEHFLKAIKRKGCQFDFQAKYVEYQLLAGVIFSDMLYLNTWAVQQWRDFVEKLCFIKKNSTDSKQKFKVIIEMNGQNLKIQIVCLDASRSFQQLKKYQPYSFIITSGTLSPMNLWEMELGIKFPNPLAVPHPIKNDQLIAYTVFKGLNGTKLDFSYQNRQNNQFLFKDLAATIVELIKNIPNGVIVLFSSYALLDSFRKNAGGTLMGNLWKEKDLFFQTKNSNTFKQDLNNYIEKSKTSKGALFFAVIRGKVSQGLDLDSDKCRAVILVGVPYLSTKNKKIQAKKKYLDSHLGKEGTLTGSQWYLAQTVRSINQAVGRVIRNVNDYGAIYLLDTRFNHSINCLISEWVRNRLDSNTWIKDIVNQTRIFFNNKAQDQIKKQSKLKAPLESQQVHPISEGHNIILTKQLKSIKLTKPRQSSSVSISHSTDNSLNKQKIEQTTQLIDAIKQRIRDPNTGKQSISSQKNNQVVIPQGNDPFKRKIAFLPQKSQKDIFTRKIDVSKQKSLYKKILVEQKPKAEDFLQEQNDSSICGVCTLPQTLVSNKACSHKFCHQCWKTWLQTNLCCPNCRTRVRQSYLILQQGDQLD